MPGAHEWYNRPNMDRFPSPLETPPGSDSPASDRARPLRILVVDDYPLNRDILEAMLVRLGQEVVLTHDGQSALDLLESSRFDLVLMDVQMPGLDGLETTRRIRAREAPTGPHLAVVALTASDNDSDAARCREAGMSDFLTKPLTLDRVAAFLLQWRRRILVEART